MSGTGDRDRDHGFTLLEMLVVMAITGLVAGLAFPAAERALRGLESRTALASTELALRTQRAQAIRSGLPARIAIAADGKALVGTPGAAWPMPDGVALAIAPQDIAFFADGSSTGGMIRLSGRLGTARLSVAPTGLVRIVR